MKDVGRCWWPIYETLHSDILDACKLCVLVRC